MNQVYLQTKREKTINEMVLIRRMKKSPTQMIGAGLVEQSKAMRIKKYQMSILNKIETSKKSVLRRWLVLCRRKLCNNCRVFFCTIQAIFSGLISCLFRFYSELTSGTF